MNDNDIKLVQLIQEVKEGNKDVYDEISNLIINEVYNLVSFVYKKEETRKKLARHVVVKIMRSVNEFDSEAMDVHMWIARFTTIEIYNVYSKQNSNIFNETNNNLSYEYHSIEEDALFEKCAAIYNRAFIDNAELNKINGKLSELTKAQKIIYEMFCYECFSIDEIEDILQVEHTYIINAIAGMKEQLCDYSQQDLSNDAGNDIEISDEEAYELNNIYSNHSKANHSQYYTIFSKKFSKKTVISVASCAAVLLLAVIVVVVISIKDKKPASNVANYGQVSTKSTTAKTQKVTNATKKSNEQTTQTQKSEETQEPTTQNSTPNQGNNTYVRPSSNGSGNVPAVQTRPINQPSNTQKPEDDTNSSIEPTDNNPDDTTEPSNDPDDTTKPSDDPDDTTKPSDDPDDTTKPSDDPDDTTKPSDEPDDTTKPSDEPDDTTKPSDEPDDTTKPSAESDNTQR